METELTTINECIIQFTRMMNKYVKLEKTPRDMGTGDLLHPSEVHIIEVIGRKPGIIAAEISQAFGITKGAVSQVLAKLVRKGYVERTRSRDYGKEVLLTLSPKGREAFDSHERRHAAMDAGFRAYLARLSPEQVEGFKEIITHIERHLDEYIKAVTKD